FRSADGAGSPRSRLCLHSDHLVRRTARMSPQDRHRARRAAPSAPRQSFLPFARQNRRASRVVGNCVYCAANRAGALPEKIASRSARTFSGPTSCELEITLPVESTRTSEGIPLPAFLAKVSFSLSFEKSIAGQGMFSSRMYFSIAYNDLSLL